MIIRNFRLSEPENIDGYLIANLKSEDGQDWYVSQSEFDPKKLKFEFDENGVITRFSDDVSMLWPVDKSVADISKKLVPEGFNENGEWVFDGKKIIPFEYTDDELREQAENKRAELLSAANEKIIPLQARLSIGRQLTDDQLKALNVLLDYIDELEACDPMAEGFIWPELKI